MSRHELWVLFAPLLEISGAAMAYGLLLRGLAGAVQPWRLRMAELGERLLASSKLGDTDRAAVAFALDHAFSPLPALLAVVLVPCVMLIDAVRWVLGRRENIAAEAPELGQVAVLSAVSFIAANPVCGILAAVEFGVLAGVASAFSGRKAIFRAMLRLQRLEALGHRRTVVVLPPEQLLR